MLRLSCRTQSMDLKRKEPDDETEDCVCQIGTRGQQTACLVVNPITVGNFAFLFNCTPLGQTSDSMMAPT